MLREIWTSEANIAVKVVIHKGDFDNSNKTEPIVGMDSWKMVLRWDAVIPLNEGFSTGHMQFMQTAMTWHIKCTP